MDTFLLIRLGLNIVVFIVSFKLHSDKRTYIFYLLVMLASVIGGSIKQYFGNALTLMFGRNHGMQNGKAIIVYPFVADVAHSFIAFEGHKLALAFVVGVCDGHN